jgi:type IX secretion system PorP/SprF family membrane protein
MRKLVAFIFVIVGFGSVYSQQSPISNFYQFNEYLLNPAEAGSQNKLEASLSHRLQWRGIQGAPESTFLGVHGALNEKMGIGGKLIIDKSDIVQQFSGAISYSYRINLGEFKKIHFGVSALGMQNNIRMSDLKISDQSDEIVNNGNNEGFAFDAEAGIVLEIKKLRIGVSSANLFESSIDFDLPSSRARFDRARSFNSYVSYSLDLNPDWKVEPVVMLRKQQIRSLQFEFNALFSWQAKFFLGAGYRDQAGFIAKTGFQITDFILAAYAYEFSNTGIASYSSGSHEFMLAYRLKQGKKKKPGIEEEVNHPVITETEIVESEVVAFEENQLNEVQPIIETEEVAKVINEDVVIPKVIVLTQEIESIDNELLTEKEPIIIQDEVKTTNPPTEQIPAPITFDEVIYFEFNNAELTEEGKKELGNMLRSFIESTDVKINIIGHTCNLGDQTINRILSVGRANAVREYLISKGVNSDRLSVIPMLDAQPAVLNDTFENRKKNRRVEFEIK